MNDAIHQLMQLILQGITWALQTFEALWVWSWNQIGSIFNITWTNLPGWKLALGLVALGVLGALFVVMILRSWEAMARIAAAFWTAGVTMFALLTFVVLTALFSRGFQWVVTTVPDQFWSASL
jgi:hypothetical protein